jgi:hypothetical protein
MKYFKNFLLNYSLRILMATQNHVKQSNLGKSWDADPTVYTIPNKILFFAAIRKRVQI